MTSFSPSSAAAALAAILSRHGLRVSADRSGLSSSRYLTVDRYDDVADDYTGPETKVRLATHEARPTYEALNGAADLEVGSHGMACTDNACDAAARILRRYEIAPDGQLATALSRRCAKAAAVQEARATAEAEQAQRVAIAIAETARLDAILAARGYDRAMLGGKKWREKRTALRRQMAGTAL